MREEIADRAQHASQACKVRNAALIERGYGAEMNAKQREPAFHRAPASGPVGACLIGVFHYGE
jgi:hypothetical protein